VTILDRFTKLQLEQANARKQLLLDYIMQCKLKLSPERLAVLNRHYTRAYTEYNDDVLLNIAKLCERTLEADRT